MRRTLAGLRSRASAPPGDAPPPNDGSAAIEAPLLCWPLDHYYSPVPDNRALAREPARSRVWPATPPETPGIDWRDQHQVSLVRDEFPRQSELSFPDGPTGDRRDYHAQSEMFSRLDASVLAAMLRQFRPRRMIEVGCGWSSLVTARVNREYLDGSLHFTCIEPYPPEFLTDGIEGISELIVSPVEQLPLDTFQHLGDGDVLFIDTSHTVKTGGDVVFLFSEVLPRLAPGVIVHIHDMFLPLDYPQDWVFDGRAWNEQYLVRAFLSFNSAFRVLLGVGYMSHFHRDVLAGWLPSYPEGYRDGGGSLWIQREPA
jgi:predicted O-methyltransferase YrrM